MKIPSLKTCLLALISRINPDSQAPIKFVNRPPLKPLFAPRPARAPKVTASGRLYSNQRQRRKDRRRANAAGVRNAFAR